MSADRELLELAARAAGIEFTWGLKQIQVGEPDTWGVRQYREEPCPMTAGRYWNPLTDDGDALRLAVKLGLYLEIDRPNTRCSALPEPDNIPFSRERYGGKRGQDACAALRRATVRAAAEIGRATTQTESEHP